MAKGDVRISNWAVRSLTPKQISYAALDAYVSSILCEVYIFLTIILLGFISDISSDKERRNKGYTYHTLGGCTSFTTKIT